MADWKTIYEDKFNESSKGYEEQKKQYEDAMAAEQAALQKRYDTAKANAKDDLEKANQQAYIARVMAEKNMPQRLAAQGITGGMTETTASNIFRNYLNSRNAANTAYTKAAADLESGYMSDSTNIQSGWTQKMADLNTQRQAQALEQAKLAYQIAVEEEERRKREEEARARSRGKGTPTTTPGDKKEPKYVDLYEGGKYARRVAYDEYMNNWNRYTKYSGSKYIY